MARPRKFRKISSIPEAEGLIPIGYNKDDCPFEVKMTYDEYETIKLIDLLGMNQEECAIKMDISRPTVTNIYNDARYKLADALINEKILLIESGDFTVCKQGKKIGKLDNKNSKIKIAVTHENGDIFQHFGHCEEFKIYNVLNGKIVDSKVFKVTEIGHGALAVFLEKLGVDILICGGIGQGAKTALSDAHITLFGGVKGSSDSAVNSLLSESLEYDGNVECSRHEHSHQSNHDCQNHEKHKCRHGNCNQ